MSPAIQNTIEVKGLTKAYGNFLAVKGVSFNVKKGEIVGFLGPNGAGKSTVMKILTCYMSATSGQVRVAGLDVAKDNLQVRRQVGYQPENVPLYEEMVVYDYLMFMAKMRGVARGQRVARIEHVSRDCGLREVMGRLIRELSKGYRQRVGLAQALVHDPDVIILDEPMAGLDPNQIIEIRDLIKHIGQEKTVIFSSHILQEIEKICDRILIIDAGKIVADGTVDDLTALLEGRRRFEILLARREGLTEASVKRALEGLGQRVQSVPMADQSQLCFRLTTEQGQDVRARVVELGRKEGWPLLELHEQALSLEDIFRALTGGKAGASPAPSKAPRAAAPKAKPAPAAAEPPPTNGHNGDADVKAEREAEAEPGADVEAADSAEATETEAGGGATPKTGAKPA